MATTRRTELLTLKSKQTKKMAPQNQLIVHNDADTKMAQGKRTMEISPNSSNKKRRTAFVDLTNAKKDVRREVKKNVTTKTGTRKSSKIVVAVPKTCPKPVEVVSNSPPEGKDDVSFDIIELSQESRLSQEVSSQSSNSSDNISTLDAEVGARNDKNIRLSQESTVTLEAESGDGWEDIDAENINDPFQMGMYAAHIFSYYKEREAQFAIPNYMHDQKDLTPHMRTILVDWLVEVQENFELNHETLYLAVKLVDLYLSKNQMPRDRLQLIGATALFIACKFDERCPPILDDFLYICDDAYTKSDVIKMEMAVLRSIGFDLGIPLSYRFLRRYAKCARAPMETLTLGRYILERSLMDYRFCQQRDSKMAAACLLLALSIKGGKFWDATLVHYTGYQQEELMCLVDHLNDMISAKPHRSLTTIFSKYSHKVFHMVAQCSPLTVEDLARLGYTKDTIHASPSSSPSS